MSLKPLMVRMFFGGNQGTENQSTRCVKFGDCFLFFCFGFYKVNLVGV